MSLLAFLGSGPGAIWPGKLRYKDNIMELWLTVIVINEVTYLRSEKLKFFKIMFVSKNLRKNTRKKN